MAGEEKDPQKDLPLPQIDLSKDIIDDDKDVDSRSKALVAFDPLQSYLAEIRRVPLLSREKEHRLAVDYKEYGNVEPAYKLVTSNLRLVVMIAREYQEDFENRLD